MFRRINRFPLVLTLLTAFALSVSAQCSHAQNLIVSEYFDHQAFEYDPAGNKLRTFSDPTASRFAGMRFDKSGYLYIANEFDQGIIIFSPSGQRLGKIIIPGSDPDDIELDAVGNIYVNTTSSNTIYRISPLGVISTFATVSGAYCMAFDRLGNLYVSSDSNNSIYKVSSTGNSSSIFASGLPGPAGMDFDGDGNLYVACRGISGTTSDEIRRFAPNGTPLFSWTSPYLRRPVSAKFGSDGNLYITDFSNGTVYRFSSVGGGEIGYFASGLDNPFGLAFKPVPASPVTAAGTLTFEGIVPTASSRTVAFEFRVFGLRAFPPKTATVLPSGAFSLPNIPRGNYTVHIKSDKYLAKNVSMDASNGDVANVSAVLKAGDANNDNFADIADLLLLVAHYNNAAGYLEACDFNGDGNDDIFDLLLLIANYNQHGDS